MTFENDYFNGRQYLSKEKLIKRHVLEVLRWASKIQNKDLLVGKGKKALDVGFAYGFTSGVLAELGYEIFGVDISKLGSKHARNNCCGQFLLSDAQTSLPFKAGTFDLVTCFDVLEHLSMPERALESMFSVCKGVLVCTTPNKKIEKPVRKLMHDYDQTHINVKTPLQWQECIISKLNFKTLRIESFYDLPLRFGETLFFKSFRIPRYGLTIRIVVGK